MSIRILIDDREGSPDLVTASNLTGVQESAPSHHRIELWFQREHLLQAMWYPDTTSTEEAVESGIPMDEYGIPTDQVEAFVEENLKTEGEPAREAYLGIAQQWTMPRPKPRLFGLFAPAPPPPPPPEWVWTGVDGVRREGDYLVIAGSCISRS